MKTKFFIKVSLIVILMAGIFNSCKKEDPKPTADFSYTGGGCTAPCQILFENKSTDAASYSWDFGDGTTSTEENPSKTYNVGGTYTITLTATGPGGTASTSKDVLIQQSTQSQLPVANFTISGGGCSAPCSISFANTSTNATSYSWDFGDGGTATSTDAAHTYNSAGAYSVILTAINVAGSNQITKIVNIAAGQLPTANFTFSNSGCSAPCTVSFTNSSSNATSYNWDFGDGSTVSTLTDPSHTYNSGGSFSVILTSTNAAGSTPITKIVNVGNAPTKVRITKITVLQFPSTDGSGASWDNNPLTGNYLADVFATITLQDNTVLYSISSANRQEDANPNGVFSWTINYLHSNLATAIYVDLSDYDDTSSNDYIGWTGPWQFNAYTTYPTTKTVTANGISVTLDLQWE